jgi:hypothetical protein
MGRITTRDSGWVDVRAEDKGSSAEVYVTAQDCGASLTRAQVRELIEDLVEVAGFKSEPTGTGMGIIIQFPESPAVHERRDELAGKFWGKLYGQVGTENQHAIEYIIDGEKQRGELK